MDTIEQTRLKFGILLVAVVAIEGIFTAFVPAFPFIAASGIQSGIYIAYVTGRTVSDIKVTAVPSAE